MRARITDTRTDRQTHRTESNRFPLRSAIDDVRACPFLLSERPRYVSAAVTVDAAAARFLVFLSFQLPPLQLSLFPAPERETSTCAHVCERETEII